MKEWNVGKKERMIKNREKRYQYTREEARQKGMKETERRKWRNERKKYQRTKK